MKKVYLLAGTSILFWSTVATVSKILLSSLSQYQLLCISALFAALALFLFNLFTGKLKTIQRYTVKDILLMIVTGLCGNFFYYACYYGGTRLMPASTAFVVNYLWPVMSVLFACLILKERMTVRKGIAFALSFVGVIIISGGSLRSLDTNMLLGTVLCVLGAAFYGAFTAFNKKYRFDLTVSMMFSYTASFLLSLLINFVLAADWSIRLPQVLGIAWNGIFTMAAGSVCWATALNRGDTAKVSNLAYITPFLSLVWVFVFLREPISLMTLLGLAVIVLGIFIQLKDNKPPRSNESTFKNE